ncbi:MAG TPA: penicillin acylase family protein, partial [Gemmatimonadales bacterium]|nr:penicillin acylase family protein [Gemmatimonadales bacterium]
APWYPLALIRYLYFENGFFASAGLRPGDIDLGVVRDTALARNTGSNGWVVGPSRSATGHPLLFINPHLPFFGPGQVYEGQVHSGSGWNFTGYTRLGFPLPYVGHGAAVGWVSTDNAADQADLYAETFDDPAHPLAYRYGTGHRTARTWTDTILVRTPAGLERRVVRFRATHHGPIVGMRDGKPLALRMARLDGDGWLGEWYAMTRARTVGELRRAMAPLAMLFGNVMAADTAGNTWYLYNGAVPRRDPRFDWSQPVDGSDPATEWRGYHGIDELPQLLNPPSGWMQNCNTSPFLLSDRGNPDPARFPPYMVREGDNLRGVAARRLLAATPRFTLAEWQRAAFDTRVTAADSFLPQLLPDTAVPGPEPALARRRAALAVLMAWDHRADTASIAMTVFDRWMAALEQLVPDGGAPGSAAAALDSALASLAQDWGTWQVPWGQVNRLERVGDLTGPLPFADSVSSVAVPGIPGAEGAVFTFYTRSAPGQRRRFGVAGASYVSVVEFGPTVRGLAVHVLGESGDPASPHYFDQAPLYARGELRPSPLTLAEIRPLLERAYRPGEETGDR